MKLLYIQIIAAESCGGLLDGLTVTLRSIEDSPNSFSPLCLIGPNGAGKSQFLQVLAEIFQLAWHECSPAEERIASNSELQFVLEYTIATAKSERPVFVRLSRQQKGNGKASLLIEKKNSEDDAWAECNSSTSSTKRFLPEKVVAYTSGDNETLSAPFLVSRGGYAKDVTEQVFKRHGEKKTVPDTRLMLIDYSTHLEVLTSNLLLGTPEIRRALLDVAPLRDLHSFRCIVQLAHSTYTTVKVPGSKRKKIQITDELESYLVFLKQCSTCHSYDEKTELYTFDFFVDDAIRTAFRSFWKTTLPLYSSFHKFSMLNDLAISRTTRERFKKETKARHFASRLAEPQEEEKVFRFERVRFSPRLKGNPVDYASLSDGEHQMGQILGTMAMMSFPNVLFLLDEPESHFNPLWRVQFISKLLDLPTSEGSRRSKGGASQQDCLLTTHAPFVPSDMQRECVLIFSKDSLGKVCVRQPLQETFGSTYDSILNECFGVRPPISEEARKRIKILMTSNNPKKIRAGMLKLGNTVEKAFIANRADQLATKPKE